MSGFRLCIFVRNATEMMLCSRFISKETKNVDSSCFKDVNFYQLVRIMSAKFLHCKFNYKYRVLIS